MRKSSKGNPYHVPAGCPEGGRFCGKGGFGGKKAIESYKTEKEYEEQTKKRQKEIKERHAAIQKERDESRRDFNVLKTLMPYTVNPTKGYAEMEKQGDAYFLKTVPNDKFTPTTDNTVLKIETDKKGEFKRASKYKYRAENPYSSKKEEITHPKDIQRAKELLERAKMLEASPKTILEKMTTEEKGKTNKGDGAYKVWKDKTGIEFSNYGQWQNFLENEINKGRNYISTYKKIYEIKEKDGRYCTEEKVEWRKNGKEGYNLKGRFHTHNIYDVKELVE